MQGEEEIVIRIPAHGDAMTIVVYLCVTGQLRFETRTTRHHNRTKMEDAVMRKIAAHPPLRNALVIATAMGCPLYFVPGSRVRVSKSGFFIGIKSDPDEVVRIVLGSNTSRVLGIEHIR